MCQGWNTFKDHTRPRAGEIIAVMSESGRIYEKLLKVRDDGKYEELNCSGSIIQEFGMIGWKLVESKY